MHQRVIPISCDAIAIGALTENDAFDGGRGGRIDIDNCSASFGATRKTEF